MNRILKLFAILLVAIATVASTACDTRRPEHTQMINAGTGEYFYLSPDQSVKGDGIYVGYSMRSTKDDRVIQTFPYAPKEVRLEDFDGDGMKDLVYIIADQSVKGDGIYVGYSMQVALGKGDGTFQQSKVVRTFASIK